MPKKKSVFDMAVDGVLANSDLTLAEIRRQFQNTRPFRQEPVDPKEARLDFEDLMSREPTLRQEFGNDIVDEFIRRQGGR